MLKSLFFQLMVFGALTLGTFSRLSAQSEKPDTASSAISIASLLVFPAPSTLVLPEIIVTAPADRLAPNSSLTASILTRAQMEPYQPRTLGEALSPIAGVDVTSYGGLGSPELISLRGSNSDRVLVLKDGQRLNSAQGGGFDLSMFSMQGVERVEVIRGLAPSRYGADGLGGIVNIITSPNMDYAGTSSFRLEGAAGSFGTAKTDGQWSGSFGGSDKATLSLSGGYIQSRGGYDFLDPARNILTVRENTDLARGTGGVQMTFPSFSDWSNRLSWDALFQNAGSPGSFEFPTPNARLETEKNILQFHSSVRSFLPNDSLSQASLNLQAHFQSLRYTNKDVFNNLEVDRHQNQSYEARLESQAALSGDWLVNPSMGIRMDDLNSTSDGIRENRVLYGALEASWFLDRFKGVELNQDHAAALVVTPGVRWEASSLYPSFLAPRLGAIWTLERSERLALKGNLGQLVRNPTFDDLFFPATGLAKGNPDLLPERSTTGDLGLNWSPGLLSVGSTLFFQELTDLIQWTPNFGGVWRPLNISQAVIYGLECEARLSPVELNEFLQWGADASFTVMEALDESGQPNVQGKQLVYRPQTKGSLGALFVFWKNLQISYRGRWIGYRYTTPANTDYVPGFFTQQLGVRVTLMKDFDLSATVYNLTGANYFEVDDYPMPGREWEVKTSLVL